MSEFSDSYHLHAEDPAAAERLVRAAGRFAAILPAGPRWTPILVDSPAGAGLDPEVVAHNAGLLLHYMFAEDHGVWVRVFEGPGEIGRIEWVWDDPGFDIEFDEEGNPIEVETRLRGFDAEILVSRGLLVPEAAERLRARCAKGAFPAPEERYLVAELLGLVHHAWISSTQLSRQGRAVLDGLPQGTRLLNEERWSGPP